MTSMFFRLTHWLSGSRIVAPQHFQLHIRAAGQQQQKQQMYRKTKQHGSTACTLRTENRKTPLNHAHKMHIWWCHAAASRWRARAHQCFWKLHLYGTHTHSYASRHTRREANATSNRTYICQVPIYSCTPAHLPLSRSPRTYSITNISFAWYLQVTPVQ